MTEELKPFQVLYDYNDVPTIRNFALDNSRFRNIQGPFGCVSGDTEFLSRYGWIKISEWSGQEIAQYDSSIRKMSFVQPIRYIDILSENPMLHFESRGLDMILSEDHRVLFRKKYNPERLQVITAKEIFEAHNSLVSGWDGMIPTAFESDGQVGVDLSDDELRLMVAVCADGHFPRNGYGTKCDICLRRLRKRTRIIELLTHMGIPFEEKVYPSRETEYHYWFDAPEKNKTLTKYWHANKHQLGIILDEMVYWDGCVENRCGVRIFSSTRKLDADFIQYVFACHNIRASISLIHQDVGQKGCYNVIENQSEPFVGMRHDTQKPLTEKVCEDRQYCFETETGFFVVRRRDKIFVTGNSGKSSGCVQEIIRRAHEQKPSPDGIRRTRWAVIRNSYLQLRDTTIKTFHDWYPPSIFGEYRVTDHTYIITEFPGVHCEVIFRALDRPDQVSNLLSLEVTGAWFNEIREIPWPIVEAMDSRIGRYPSKRDGGASWFGIISDTNPPSDDSTLYKIFEKIRPDGYKIFKQPSGLSVHAENLRNLPSNYYINLAKGKDEMYIRIYIHGQYGYLVSGKPVFISYRDNIHVAPRPIEVMKGIDVLVGFDFGLQPACTIGQLTPLGQLRILDELVSDGMGIQQFCLNQVIPLLRKKYFGLNVMGYGDPSGVARMPTNEDTCFNILHSHEIGLTNITEAPTNAILPRVGAVETYLNKMINGEPAFIISPNCHFIRKAMAGGYHYEKERKSVGGVEYKPMPQKNFSCVDGETEILTFDGWKYRDEVNIGTKVFGYKNGMLVKDTIEDIFDYNGGIECIKFSSPIYEFIFTENHRCYTVHKPKEDIRIVTADKISGNHSFLTSAHYKDDSHKLLISNWFIKLCAWVLTEGCYRKDGSIVIVQSILHSPEYVKVIDKLLCNSPYLVNRCIYNDVVRWKINKELAILIRHMMPDKCPSYEFVMKMRNPQRRLFLYECLCGDGFNGGSMPEKETIGRNRDFFLNRKYTYGGKITPRLTAKRKHHIDVLQMLATMVGIETHIRIKRQNVNGAYDLSFIDKCKINTGRMKKEKVIVNSVWCPKTSTGAWVMRRQGIVLITGNSHIADSLEYLCLYLTEKISYDAARKQFLAQLKQPTYRPGSYDAGY